MKNTSYTREPGLGNTLTSAEDKCVSNNCISPSSSSPRSLAVCLSVPCLVRRVLENINRMHSCLIVNPLSSALWPQALDHVRSPTALSTPSPIQTPSTPTLLLRRGSQECVCLCDMCTCALRTVVCLIYCYPTLGLETWLWAGFVTTNHWPHLACN